AQGMPGFLLVLLCVVLWLLGLYGMLGGWRTGATRQAGLPSLPPVPAELDAAQHTLSGLYVGTTFASSWQDRVVHEGLGLRAACTATLHRQGVLIDREGATPVFLPRTAIDEARLAPGLAGKVMGEGGLLVIRWHLGDAELDTGLRADDKTTYPDWVHALSATDPTDPTTRGTA
ncbi:MAG: PH-like domain-containing protein, partial [Jatrophihabitans sp.]|uniref:PH-like domain-containing protein n=1 Tax=Jatrophihabitans sp. TaxID=1932789 RepID=UPI003F80DFB1